jgi:hypothetical protein
MAAAPDPRNELGIVTALCQQLRHPGRTTSGNGQCGQQTSCPPEREPMTWPA